MKVALWFPFQSSMALKRFFETQNIFFHIAYWRFKRFWTFEDKIIWLNLKFKLCEGMYIGNRFYQGRRRMIYKSGGK